MKTNMQTATGRINTERRGNDINGNPRYRVALSIEGQDPVIGNTPAGACYLYSMPKDGPAKCTWHVTAVGRVIFNNIERI